MATDEIVKQRDDLRAAPDNTKASRAKVVRGMALVVVLIGFALLLYAMTMVRLTS